MRVTRSKQVTTGGNVRQLQLKTFFFPTSLFHPTRNKKKKSPQGMSTQRNMINPLDRHSFHAQLLSKLLVFISPCFKCLFLKHERGHDPIGLFSYFERFFETRVLLLNIFSKTKLLPNP